MSLGVGLRLQGCEQILKAFKLVGQRHEKPLLLLSEFAFESIDLLLEFQIEALGAMQARLLIRMVSHLVLAACLNLGLSLTDIMLEILAARLYHRLLGFSVESAPTMSICYARDVCDLYLDVGQ